MLNDLFGTRVQDPYFGNVKVFTGSEPGTFMLEHIINFGPFPKIALYLENISSKSTQHQFDQYNLIRTNADDLLSHATEYYSSKYNTSLLDEYELEFVSIKENSPEWEMAFVRKGGFEYCIVEYNGMKLEDIYFDA